MRTILRLFTLALLAAPAQVSAQGDDPVSASLRAQLQAIETNWIASAEQIPESLYDYSPTDDVRSFGELIGHVANAQYQICSDLQGVDNPNQRNLEELSTKAELVAAIRGAWDHCAPAYAESTDAALGDQVPFFGGQTVRHYPMAYGLMHAWEHYGNVVTYMRLNGMVPPSSQGG